MIEFDRNTQLLDLMRIPTPLLYREDSLVSSEFRAKPRMVTGCDYDAARPASARPFHVCSPPGAGPSVFGDRVFVHRVNSKEKLKELFATHTGFELDLVYEPETRLLDVRHPPAETSGLDLFAYLSSAPSLEGKHFWLDIKNLDRGNVREVLQEIERIAAAFSLKERLIVESQSIELLPEFVARDFYASYYLPSPKDFANQEAWLSAIDSALRQYRVNAVSGPYKSYVKLKERFLNHDVLVWFPPKDLDELMLDPRVKVVLVKRVTAFDR